MTRLERELLELKKLFWNGDTFGAGPLPQNWEEICGAVNSELACLYMVIAEDALDKLEEYSEALWEQLCETDEVLGIRAVWED